MSRLPVRVSVGNAPSFPQQRSQKRHSDTESTGNARHVSQTWYCLIPSSHIRSTLRLTTTRMWLPPRGRAQLRLGPISCATRRRYQPLSSSCHAGLRFDAGTSATCSRLRVHHLCWRVAPLGQEDSQLLLLALRWQVDKWPQHSLRDDWRGERITLGDNQF